LFTVQTETLAENLRFPSGKHSKWNITTNLFTIAEPDLKLL